jgi:hypothetical protein
MEACESLIALGSYGSDGTILSCPSAFWVQPSGAACSLLVQRAAFWCSLLVQPSRAAFWCSPLVQPSGASAVVQLSGALICFTFAALWCTILFHLSETHCMLTPLGSKSSSASVHASYYWF